MLSLFKKNPKAKFLCHVVFSTKREAKGIKISKRKDILVLNDLSKPYPISKSYFISSNLINTALLKIWYLKTVSPVCFACVLSEYRNSILILEYWNANWIWEYRNIITKQESSFLLIFIITFQPMSSLTFWDFSNVLKWRLIIILWIIWTNILIFLFWSLISIKSD